jgi:hypothetical protein
MEIFRVKIRTLVEVITVITLIALSILHIIGEVNTFYID